MVRALVTLRNTLTNESTLPDRLLLLNTMLEVIKLEREYTERMVIEGSSKEEKLIYNYLMEERSQEQSSSESAEDMDRQ